MSTELIKVNHSQLFMSRCFLTVLVYGVRKLFFNINVIILCIVE